MMIIKSNFEIRIHKIAVVFLYGMLGKSNYDRRVYRKNNKTYRISYRVYQLI